MYVFWWFFAYYLRPIVKWFLRKTTGLCELQRICYGKVQGAPRTKAVDYSLCMSKSPQIAQLIAHLNDVSDNQRFVGSNLKELTNGAVNTVMLVKKINPKIHFQFVINFGQCVEQIWGYRQLLAEVEELRKTVYDADNFGHERKLQDLWEKLMPHERLEGRVTKQWQYIGFQGDDPKTDFRGMGLLGLENLLAFASDYQDAATYVLSHSHHPHYGYAFAIVGINLTSLAWTLLKQGDAKTYFFNMVKSAPSLKLFHQFYSYLFYEFDKYWIECKPKDIMEFSTIKDNFEINVRNALQDPNAVFRINFSVDTI
ncbi:ELMO domain-containing protein 2 [Tribolium castaneum]|uniref:ELMO domain-containing protein 1-like Protein n=1 Tax=Tribolium castaneum TaxID=7070 RepID=D6X3X4_TRICA|nr:PREDICTED: ELMO domain-containing protein 2 [Tribolium castaneum]EEZ97357.1 ELMO domain-containing protein 1-like Protein [Tribolium castaneum]|eukprot:XP_968111.1 PREDICTED: ELMO domain-containing protein 2 [Tribolium castaneum]